MSGKLASRTVVIIGGSSGIGAAVAMLAHSEGADVISVSRSGKAVAGKGVAADVTIPGSLRDALQRCNEIDHLVHTAGARVASAPLGSLDMESAALAFQTKLFSAIEAVKVILPLLSPSGSITLTSGQVSRKFGIGSMLKGAINAATDAVGKHLAKELAPRRVNVISPGVINTDLWGDLGSSTRQATMERVAAGLPVKRVGTSAELAQAYLFLMTSGFATGTVLDIDGGGLL